MIYIINNRNTDIYTTTDYGKDSKVELLAVNPEGIVNLCTVILCNKYGSGDIEKSIMITENARQIDNNCSYTPRSCSRS